jgi:hypothetical protein
MWCGAVSHDDLHHKRLEDYSTVTTPVSTTARRNFFLAIGTRRDGPEERVRTVMASGARSQVRGFSPHNIDYPER